MVITTSTLIHVEYIPSDDQSNLKSYDFQCCQMLVAAFISPLCTHNCRPVDYFTTAACKPWHHFFHRS